MKIFLHIMLQLFVVPLALLANMAKPTIDGSTVSAIFGNDNCVVKHENIIIKLIKDPLENTYNAQYTIKYSILSDKDQLLSLSFIAINLLEIGRFTVNGSTITTKRIDNDQQLPSYIKKSATGYSISYDAENGHAVSLDNIIQFTAALKKGENTIEVNYIALLEFNTYGFVKNFKIDYAIYPSRYWKKFGQIDLELNLGDSTKVIESNIGSPIINKNLAHWTINNLNNENIIIKITEKRSFLQEAVLWISPLGFGIIISAILAFFNAKLWLKSKRKSTFWIGIIIVPIIFIVIYFFSYDFINYILDQDSSRHGYYFFIVIFYPLFVLIYSLFLYAIRYLLIYFSLQR